MKKAWSLIESFAISWKTAPNDKELPEYVKNATRLDVKLIQMVKTKENILSTTSTMGARITEAREISSYSIAETASRMAVTEMTIKKWEKGNSKPRGNKLQMLAGVLNVSLLWLLDGDEQFDPVQSQPDRLEALEQKVERMNGLQLELLKLSNEVITEIDELRKIDDELNTLAA